MGTRSNMNMNLILPPEQLSKALAAWQRLSGPEWRLKALQRPSKRRLMQLAAAGGLAAYLWCALPWDCQSRPSDQAHQSMPPCSYYYIHICKRPALYYQQASPFARLVLQRCPLLHQPYRWAEAGLAGPRAAASVSTVKHISCLFRRPTVWAVNKHLQTVLSGALWVFHT